VCFGSFSTGAAGFAHGSMSAFPQKHLLTGRQRNDAKGHKATFPFCGVTNKCPAHFSPSNKFRY
jgi:hypothetical protein